MLHTKEMTAEYHDACNKRALTSGVERDYYDEPNRRKTIAEAMRFYLRVVHYHMATEHRLLYALCKNIIASEPHTHLYHAALHMTVAVNGTEWQSDCVLTFEHYLASVTRNSADIDVWNMDQMNKLQIRQWIRASEAQLANAIASNDL